VRRAERKWPQGRSKRVGERANRVVGGLPSEGIQKTATGFRNDADDQVVLRELRSGGDLEVPASAKARGRIAMHSPGHGMFLHGLPDHQHLTSHRYLVGSPGDRSR